MSKYDELLETIQLIREECEGIQAFGHSLKVCPLLDVLQQHAYEALGHLEVITEEVQESYGR